MTLPLLHHLSSGRNVVLVTRARYAALLPECWRTVEVIDIEGSAGSLLFAGVLPGALSGRVPGSDCHLFTGPDADLAALFWGGGAARVTCHNPRPTGGGHVVEQYFSGAGLSVPAGVFETPVLGAGGQGCDLWVHAGSGSASKTCPPAFFAALARGWSAPGRERISVSFGEADLELREPVAAAFAARGLAYREVVCPSLARLRRMLSMDAGLFLGNDTGVTHLAAALGIPVIACFRSTDPALWRPLGRCLVLPPAAADPLLGG